MSVLSLKLALPCFLVSILRVLAVRNNKVDLHHLGVEEIPHCKVVAALTYPGFCNPSVSGFACYSLHADYTPLDQPNVSAEVQWACSPDLDVGEMTDESCKQRPWNYKSKTWSGQEVEFVAEGIYEGLCKLDASTPLAVEGPAQHTAPETPAGAAEGSTEHTPAPAPETPAPAGSPEPEPSPSPAPSLTIEPASGPSSPPSSTKVPGAAAGIGTWQARLAPVLAVLAWTDRM
mmetsp:Transcript_20667/g.58084  ORF Transcript_20667/g.58084 Transcript_20667/m.58084 type:complete len:232 (-) Transcript_20667:94-789(-)